jgi:hypothetical protein
MSVVWGSRCEHTVGYWCGLASWRAISHPKVLFSDDCANCDSNVMFWSQENLHFTQEPEHIPLHVMSSAGVTAGHVTGPYFLNEPMSIASNLAMLEVWLKPRFRVLWMMWLQCDGMCTYFAVSVHIIWTECFASHWIGRGSATFMAPLTWSWRSPDLTTRRVPCGVVSR